ncbi:hypothetical protein MLD38_018745 [Melastoma candidum]|uniref:Uncharacterized protein n=1 Tax=Melastoma candidum TaxID=119954 RepID=A0ACB9R311_9MYRT|nr:hypothetical protein MLD38_018745 [Melastoma candidum]
MLFLLRRRFPLGKKLVPSLPPGPRGLPVVGNLPFLDWELHSYLTRLAKTHGPIMRLRLGRKTVIVVSSSSLAEEVLKDHDVIFANRDGSVASLAGTYDGKDVTFCPYGPEWRTLRKVCSPKMLSNTTLNSVYPLRQAMVRQSVRQIYDQAGEPVNIGDRVFTTAFNVVTNMIWGSTIRGPELGRLGAEFREIVSEMTLLSIKPNVSDFFPRLAPFDLHGIEKKMRSLHAKFDALFNWVICKRLELDKEGSGNGDDTSESSSDFLQYLLKLKEEGDADVQETPFTMKQLKALLLVCRIYDSPMNLQSPGVSLLNVLADSN